MCGLKVRFSQSPERRGVFAYSLKVEVVSATDIPSKIFVYHQAPAGIDGNTFAEFDHVATPVDFQEIPEDAASETVPWFRTDKFTGWFRNVSDLNLAKQMFVDDIAALQRTYDTLTSEDNFMRQSDIEFSSSGVHEESAPTEEGSIERSIAEMKSDIEGKLSKDALDGVEFETNDAAGLREAVKIMGNALGAKIVKSIALACGMLALSAYGAGFSGVPYAQMDLDENPVVVTNVTFDGLVTYTDISSFTQSVARVESETKDGIRDVRLYVDTQLQNMYQAAVGYTDGVVTEFRSWTNGIWTAVDTTVANIASNTVEAILSPTSVEFALAEEYVHSGAIMPNWTTSSLRITRGSATDGGSGGGRLDLYPSGKLRNYSVLIEEVSADYLANGVFIMSFDEVLSDGGRLFATPAVYKITEEMSGSDGACQYGWLLTTNDVPCVITIREPEAGMLLVRRDKVESTSVK